MPIRVYGITDLLLNIFEIENVLQKRLVCRYKFKVLGGYFFTKHQQVATSVIYSNHRRKHYNYLALFTKDTVQNIVRNLIPFGINSVGNLQNTNHQQTFTK